LARAKKSKREYLSDVRTRDLTNQLNRFFEFNVEIPRIRIGKKQTFEILINEEALLLAKYLRVERQSWIPRVAVP
jgi:hypothetical protein